MLEGNSIWSYLTNRGYRVVSVVWTLLTVCTLDMLALFAAIRSQLLKR